MVERVEELNLPNAVISKLVKEALPPGVNVSKEAKSAITRAASVFILYLTSTANTSRLKQNKKKMFSSQHVFEALEEIEFESFVPPLKEALEVYRENLKEKKDKKKSNPGEPGSENTEEPDAIEEFHSEEEVDN